MNISKKEKYLEQVRNHMLFHYSHRDISSTLEDLNLYFESGTADGRTEEELCDEFGDPQQFVCEISQDKAPSRASFYLSAAYAIGCCILFVLGLHVVQDPSQLLCCIATAAIPVFLWYSFGGCSLLQLRNDTAKAHKAELLYFILASALVIAEQVFIVLIHYNFYSMAEGRHRGALTIYYLAWAGTALSTFVFLTAAYKVYKGYYLSWGSVSCSIGAIFSSLLCIFLLLHMEKPIPFSIHMACILPFAISVVLSAVYYLILRRKGRQPWIHR